MKHSDTGKVPAYRVEKITETKDQPHRATIDVQYPVFIVDGASDKGDINTYVRSLIEPEIEAFLSEVEARGQLPEDEAAGGSSFRCDFEPLVATEPLVSLHLRCERYVAGAAHPIHWTKTVTANRLTLAVVSLTDLFSGAEDALDLIAMYARRSLRDTLGDTDLLAEGTRPIADNFRAFLITPTSLQILFDEYQVAPYAAGPQQVDIPWQQLRSAIPTDSLLQQLVQ
ncbi:MAG: DUF3298 domain-containing protein [Bdellovibrionales bacterium]|nr:DUF3298 domain-containing protein [Bdellovibrionales bacterium]